jgi:anti-sigma B factor antagonist
MPEPFTVDQYAGPLEGQDVLCLRGPLTADHLLSFQNAIRRYPAPTVILDLSDVPYVDSAGLGSLVGAHVSRQKLGCRVVLAGVNERVLRLFEITRVESLFLMFPTLDDALQALAMAGRA